MGEAGQALAGFAIFVVIAGGVMILLTRRTRNKMRDLQLDDESPALVIPRTRRQQRAVAQIEPAKPRPTIEQLVAEEAAATGVNDIPGGESLDVSLKLRVFWRDEVVRKGCTDGHLEFRVDEGVEPSAADTDDVRLVCVRDGAPQTDPDRSSAGEPEEPADDDGNPNLPSDVE